MSQLRRRYPAPGTASLKEWQWRRLGGHPAGRAVVFDEDIGVRNAYNFLSDILR